MMAILSLQIYYNEYCINIPFIMFLMDIARFLQYLRNLSDSFINNLAILQDFNETFSKYSLNITLLCGKLLRKAIGKSRRKATAAVEGEEVERIGDNGTRPLWISGRAATSEGTEVSERTSEGAIDDLLHGMQIWLLINTSGSADLVGTWLFFLSHFSLSSCSFSTF